MKDLVVSFGEMLMDFVPTVSGVSLAEAPGFLKAPGGAPANVAIAVSRLGGNSAFVGKLGNDEFGHTFFRGRVDSFRVQAVDTTGAGDSFVGGLLKKITGDDAVVEDEGRLRDALRFACACGAITTTGKGTIPSLPNSDQVLALMDQQTDKVNLDQGFISANIRIRNDVLYLNMICLLIS